MQGVVIGVTGGLATGKSTFAGLLRRNGAALYSVDEAAHTLYRPGTPTARAIRRRFGAGVADAAGGIDRRALGRRVTSGPGALRALEHLVHPPLARLAAAAVSRMKRRHRLVVVEAGPLLYRLGLGRLADRVVLTRCPRALRVARLVRGRGISRAEAARRLRAFGPAERSLLRTVRGRRNVVAVSTDRPVAGLGIVAAALVRGGRPTW